MVLARQPPFSTRVAPPSVNVSLQPHHRSRAQSAQQCPAFDFPISLAYSEASRLSVFLLHKLQKSTRDNTRTERLDATANMLIKYVTETSTSCTNAANFAIQQGPNIDWQGDRARHRVRLQGIIGQTL